MTLRLSWSTRFRLRQYLLGSLWVLPLIGALAGVLLGGLASWSERHLDLPTFWEYSAPTASTLLSTIVGATAALTGFVLTVSVLVVQMAASSFSARYMRLWYRDRLLKVALAVLIGTLTFSFALLRRVEADTVPDLGVTMAGALVVVSLILFLLFLDRFLHRMRPVAVAVLVAQIGHRAFAEALEAASARAAPQVLHDPSELRAEPTLVVRAFRGGAIQAVDADGLGAFAAEHGAVLVLAHAVGDFVPSGGRLIEAYGGTFDRDRAERALRGMVALGVERTIEQDPAFAIRIMVDVAIKALSPAINDPTTAVQVLNHLGDLLGTIGTTKLEWRERAALVVPTRRWEDFLALGVTEIREYGASSVQVNRRLRALLEDLHATVLPENRAAVEDELTRLDASVADGWADSPDLDRASERDGQGIGGPRRLAQRQELSAATTSKASDTS